MQFPDTCWTLLAQATLNGGTREKAALEQLCKDYWHPVCACIRGRGAPPDRVEDLTQDFFLHLMEKGVFRRADQAKGRFRTFLLGALRYFLANDAEKNRTAKRGGLLERCELQEDSAITEAAEMAFDREWAQTLLSRALLSVQAECCKSRGIKTWELLRTWLPGSAAPAGYARLAKAMGISENGAKTEVSRMRQRYKEALRREVARIVTQPDEIDSELQHLRAALGAGLV
jgi:DNA-directed RNA polymerase specialized sigma24 family protein